MASYRILEHRKVDGGMTFVDGTHHCHSNPPAQCVQAPKLLCVSYVRVQGWVVEDVPKVFNSYTLNWTMGIRTGYEPGALFELHEDSLYGEKLAMNY